MKFGSEGPVCSRAAQAEHPEGGDRHHAQHPPAVHDSSCRQPLRGGIARHSRWSGRALHVCSIPPMPCLPPTPPCEWWPSAPAVDRCAAAPAQKSRQTLLLHAHGDDGRQYQERYESQPPCQPARSPSRLAVTGILYPKHPLIPSPNPVPTRSFAGSGLSETADRAILFCK